MYDSLIKIADPVGITGVILLLTAFFLLNMGRLRANSLIYQFLNLIAAVLILFSLFFHWNTPSVLIEIAWIGISLVGIFRILILQKEKDMKKVV